MSKLVLLGYAGLITYASVRPMDSAPLEPWDKVGHLAIYAIFALLARRAVPPLKKYTYLCIAIFIYSGVLETVQSQLPGRAMSEYDLLANGIGIAIGFYISKKIFNGQHI
ncbi:VanZ family protein [Halioglobus maricola]|uniref:VanZ family protein n=1 Tax=Halioglobus maricola TaxID=2601894 RepID=A0A5P9NHW9_9GAMM|nr:VanZ family protein [Halioglobus maricola]QFU75125.1 VanZ family protein [Halioglobus maricola]